MCGILGKAGSQSRVDRDVFERAAKALAHRGPDGFGSHFSDGVALGHLRLSIIDLGGGAQPLYNEDRSICLVHNGEIYNYVELRDQLEAHGHVFRTGSDSEVIVHGYEEWGELVFGKLRGMFGIALWDSNRAALLLVRDRLGKKPIYYVERPGDLAFASEVKALLKFPGVETELEESAIEDYLRWKVVPGEDSAFKGIKKLLPGSILTFENDQSQISRYWEVSMQQDDKNLSDEEWKERLESELREAVRIRLRSDVPLGVFLSGGIDSGSVVALAAEESGGSLSTYSIGFKDEGLNELPLAKLVAERYGTDHTEILVENHAIDDLEKLAYYLDEPFGDPSALPTYVVCREARKYVTVCLSGDGGDEFFGGYSRYRHALAATQRYDWIPRPLRSLAVSCVRPWYNEKWKGWGELRRIESATPGARYVEMMSAFSGVERRALLGRGGGSDRELAGYFDRNPSYLHGMMQMDQENYLPDDILVKVDRMSMMVALEVRSPLLDSEVVGLANRAPDHVKLRDGNGKWLLRHLMKDRLPREVMEGKKRGFGLPICNWFRNDLKDFLRDALASKDTRISRVVDPKVVSRLVDAHQAGGRDLSERLWVLLMLELWMRAYGV